MHDDNEDDIDDDDDDDYNDDDECLYVYADSCRKSSLPESGMRRQVLPRAAGSHASKTLRGAQRDDDDQHDSDDWHDADDQHDADEGAELNVQKNAT